MNLETVAARAVEIARWLAVPKQAEETVSRHVRVYEGAVESLSDAGDRGLGLRVRGQALELPRMAPT